MQLFYKKYGSGAPLVILHGLYGSSDNWHSIAKVLSEKFEVIIPDARNHGKSAHSREHQYTAMMEDVLELFEELKLEKPIVMGHSMGGKTAMLLALTHPEKVKKLVVVDIAPKSYKSLLDFNPEVIQHMNILQAFSSVDISKMKSRAEVDQAFSQYVKDASVRQFLLKNADRREDGSFYWALNFKALQQFFPQIMDWPETQESSFVPTLFIRGEKSGYIREKDEEKIKQLFPQAEISTIFDAGHWVHAEQQERFLHMVLQFLEKE